MDLRIGGSALVLIGTFAICVLTQQTSLHLGTFAFKQIDVTKQQFCIEGPPGGYPSKTTRVSHSCIAKAFLAQKWPSRGYTGKHLR